MIFQFLLEIQPKGPYNIVGETWNGCVALELSRLLEESGHNVTLMMLNATPHTLQLLTKAVGSSEILKFNRKLLSILFQLKPNVSIKFLTSSFHVML